MMLAVSGALTSCLNDSSSSQDTYGDTAVTAVTLGTLNRYTRTVSSTTGNDTIIKTTLTGSNYKMNIDQLGCNIFNRDSLPVGTDLKHVTISTLSTKNGGVAFVKSLISDTLFYVRTTDSLDFTQPRTLRIIASDGIEYRDYTMTLNASATTGTTFAWQRVTTRDDLAGWTDKRLVTLSDTVGLVDKGTVAVRSNDDNVTYMRVNGNGYVESANTDGDSGGWTEVRPASGETPGLAVLIGATDHEIFAMGTDGRMKVCTDGAGREWRDEQLDDAPTLLPTTMVAMTSWKYAPADDTDYVLMVGACDAEQENAVGWRKLSQHTTEGTEGTWVYMPVDGYNKYALPKMEYVTITYYNNSVLAVGSDMKLYQSRDQGITWKTTSAYALPEQMEGTRAAIATDRRNRLWIVTDSGELWMGTLR